MALSGQLIWGPTGNGAYFSFEWTATQNTNSRTSTISWKMYGRGRSSSPTYIASNYYLSVDGSQISALTGSWDGTSKFSFNDAQKDSGSFTVYHDSSGAGSFYTEIYAYISSSSYNWDTVGQTFYLDNIGSLNYSWKSLGNGSASSVSFSLSEYQVGYYLYTPSSNGTLVTYSSGSYDTYGNILDNSKTFSLGSNDASGSSVVSGTKTGSTTDDYNDMNFYCSSPVEANKTYRIYVHEYNGTPAISGTLYMSFTANKTITYYANGYGTAPSAQSVVAGNSITLRSKINNQTVNSYTVTYYANGGTSTPSTQTSTKTYAQITWNTNSSGTGTNYTPGTSYTINNDLSLYAIWDNGTQNSINLASSISHNPDELKRIVTFNTREGLCSTETLTSTATTTYSFSGWKENNTGTALAAGSTYTPSKNVSMYAFWDTETSNYSSIILPYASIPDTETLITIKLDANKGNCEFKSFTVKGITKRIFEGWYYNNTKIGSGGSSYIPTATMTLTAKYSNQSTSYNQIFLPTPYRPGYKFLGWSTNPNDNSGIFGYYIPTGNNILYAIWRENIVFININGSVKKAQTFIFNNNQWNETQIFINNNNQWCKTG